MIRILIVEDTPVVQKYLEHILNSDPRMHVIGIADNGEEAIKFLKHNKPDIITMDIIMPGMNGFETTRKIMETTPVPIVIVSGSADPAEIAVTFKAMEAGAVAITLRPPGFNHPNHEPESIKLIELIRTMSEVKVIRRRPVSNGMTISPALTIEANKWMSPVSLNRDIGIIAIGASTGGPPVIKAILQSLPKELGSPVLIVQHIAQGFIQGFTEWLNESTPLPVSVGSDGEIAKPGHVYIAPDNFHMGIRPSGVLDLKNGEPEHGLRPSVSYLFRSVSNSYGRRTIGIILTGMGTDGARELLMIRNKGGITIAQNAETSVVHGMPGEAIRINAAMHILPPDMIAITLKNLTENIKGSSYG